MAKPWCLYLMMQVPYRILLPTVLGSISGALVLWDLYNLRVIQSMGMAWDTGAPIWPFEAANLILSALNGPVYVLSSPLFLMPHLNLQERRYPVLLPAIIIWWWWIGTRADSGILGLRRWPHPRRTVVAAVVLGTALKIAGVLTINLKSAVELDA